MTARWLVIALLALGLGSTLACAADLQDRMLPDGRFRDWVSLQRTCTATALTQAWRTPVTNLPKGAEGYLMVAYHVERAPSVAEASTRAQAFTRRERFNEYAARGYTVGMEGWAVGSAHGVLFTVGGLNHDTEKLRMHRAEIFTYATTYDDWVVCLEVRQSAITPEMEQAPRILKNAGGRELAETLVGNVQAIWQATPAATPAKPVETPKPADAKSAETPKPTDAKPAETPKPADTKPAETPKPADTKPTETPKPIDAKLAETPKPTDAKPAETPKPTEAKPADPPKTTETPKPVDPPKVDTPKPADTTKTENPNPADTPKPAGPPRWRSADAHLSMAVPEGWKPEGANPVVFKAAGIGEVRLFPAEPYADAAERAELLQSFIATQREVSISAKRFSQRPFNIDGAVGVQARYTSVTKDTIYAYFFGKTNRLWRVEVELAGDNAALPEAVARWIEGITVE